MKCQYALSPNKEIVYIDEVENGLKCNCTCISCGERLLAKNGGSYREHHFSHESGHDCGGYKETILHIWSKQVIKEYKALSIPNFKGVGNGHIFIDPYNEKTFGLPDQKLHFVSVEIEQRADFSGLQPDIVGVTEDGLRLWIEIFVTHKCSEAKVSTIIEKGINCIEVKIPDSIETEEALKDFLLESVDSEYKCFINYPYGEKLIQDNKRVFYNELKSRGKQVSADKCHNCFRTNIIPRNYDRLLSDYKGRLPSSYNYIFKIRKFNDLVSKYPKLVCLPDALIHKKHFNDDDVELEFAFKLSNLFKFYDYGSTCSFYWNCGHIFATSIKNDKEYVFCDNKEYP